MANVNSRYDQERALMRCLKADHEDSHRYGGGTEGYFRRLRAGKAELVWHSAGQQMLDAWLPVRSQTIDFIDFTTDEVLVLDRAFAVYLVKREMGMLGWQRKAFAKFCREKRADDRDREKRFAAAEKKAPKGP